MQRLRDLIAEKEGWLTARIIHYAKQRGFMPYTSTLEQAWLASICGLSAPLIGALEQGRNFWEESAIADPVRDPIANYGVEVARRHRPRGITLGLFLGLMKSYRRTYLDLVDEFVADPVERSAFRDIVESFFDRMEVGICTEWAGQPTTGQLEQLSARNRLITNEKNKYVTIFESLRDPVVLVDESGRVENMNYAATRLFAGQGAPGAAYYGGERPALAALLGVDVAAAAGDAHERELATTQGPRWFDIKMQRMLDVSEKYLGTVVILADVTEYRLAKERAEAANRAKSTFLATMSHEIRTPIHGILGVAELLRQGDLGDRDRGCVEAIARSGEMLSSVIADILDYSKIEAGVLDVEHVEFAVADVVEDVFALLQPLLRQKPRLDLQVALPTLPAVVGDPGKLRQILLNVVGNAVKFTDGGSVRLTVAAVADRPDDCELRFDVADTGIGIAADKLATIFEPFRQSDSSISRRFGGSGLGLAVCRRLVEACGGRIEVESRLGEGSRFRIALPFARGTGRLPAGGGDGRPPGVARSVRALDLLVVEDNEVNALVAQGQLERLGHRPRLAASGAAALAAAAAADFDLVLLDLRLPDMDGLDVARAIRALADPARARVPIVALSAHVLRDDIQTCLDAGIDDFLGKPFQVDRLEAMLRRVLGVSSPRAATPARAASGPPGAALVDEGALLDHVKALGRDHAARIVATYRDSVATLSHDLECLAETGDWARIAELAHRLRSSSSHVGLNRLAARAGEVERAARRTEPGTAALVGGLALELEKSLAALDFTWRAIDADQPAKT